jgi:hypothetical protein
MESIIEGEEKSLTSEAAVLSQVGGVLLYGSADDEIPFPRLCIRPMAALGC